MIKKKLWQEFIVVGIITSFLTFIILQIWNMRFSIPLNYQGDGLYVGYNVKTIQETGWWFENSRVGAPFNGTMYDFSSLYFDSLSFFILKIIVLFIKNWGKTINTFYIFLFPITALTSHYTMRKLNVNFYTSMLSSIYFTFLQYRFLRGTAHIFLSAYYLIPLVTLLFYWLYTDDNVLTIEKDFFHNKKNIFSIVLLILLSLSGIYYTFFSCFFVIVIFLIKVNKYNIKQFLKKFVLSFSIIGITMFLAYIPAILYKLKVGINEESPLRYVSETEFYALRISRLFISQKLFYLKGQYFEKVQKNILNYLNFLKNSEGMEYLGIIAIIGFFYLLWVLLKRKKEDNELINLLAILNITGILLAVASGFATMFAIFVSPQIRAYNRISVFIAYFCILAISIKIDNLLKEKNKKTWYPLVLVLFLFSIWDQIPSSSKITYTDSSQKYKKEFDSDKTFILKIEKILGKDGMVFQLPYFKFPETGNIKDLGDYELFKGYLFSENIKWSYGGYKGRESDLWNRYIVSLPINEMLEKISIVGFNGIYIDRKAYTVDEYTKLENEIKNIIKEEAYVSDDKKLVFFNLMNFSNSLKNKYSEEQLKEEKNKILKILLSFDGFYKVEQLENRKWRWMKKNSVITVENKTSGSINYILKSTVFSEYPENSELIVEFNGKKGKYLINNKGTEVNLSFNIGRGKNIIKFYTNSKRVNSDPDPRELYLRFENIEAKLEK